LAQIEPQDGLPRVACTKCIEQVHKMVHFIEICQVSNKILTHLIRKYHVSFDSIFKFLFRVAGVFQLIVKMAVYHTWHQFSSIPHIT